MTKNPVRSPPIILAATSRTPPIALLRRPVVAVAVPGRHPPDVVLKRNAMTMRAYVRQGDTSHFSNGCDDLYFYAVRRPVSSDSTFSWHSFSPFAELAVFLEFFLVAFPIP